MNGSKMQQPLPIASLPTPAQRPLVPMSDRAHRRAA